MNKYQICLQSIVDAIALLFGYKYDIGACMESLNPCPSEDCTRKFFDFGYSRLDVDTQVFWGFGKQLVLSRVHAHQSA